MPASAGAVDPPTLKRPHGAHASRLLTPPPHPTECLRDLLGVAGRLLRVGGRLVFFIPAAPGYYFEAQLPRHPALEVSG